MDHNITHSNTEYISDNNQTVFKNENRLILS